MYVSDIYLCTVKFNEKLFEKPVNHVKFGRNCVTPTKNLTHIFVVKFY